MPKQLVLGRRKTSVDADRLGLSRNLLDRAILICLALSSLISGPRRSRLG